MEAPTALNASRGPIPCDGAASRSLELLGFVAALLAINAPLFMGGSTDKFAFLPAAVADGEWWRVITHLFAHVTWYHLLLDGAAFLLLYWRLDLGSSRRRLGACAATAFGSLTAAVIASPVVAEIGLRGLSGVAHGLMAITALTMIRESSEPSSRRIGWCCLAAVVGKSLLEALTGNAALPLLHFGLMGTPIAVCHFGGVLGALLFWSGSEAVQARLVVRQAGARAGCNRGSSARVARGNFGGASNHP